MRSAAASPLRGSVGFGYRSSCGMKTSKMLIMSYMGDHVWLMTSRQTEPELATVSKGMRSEQARRSWSNVQFINVGVEYPVHEADAGTLVRVLIRQLDVNLPETALKRCYSLSAQALHILYRAHTVFWTLEPYIELLPVPCQLRPNRYRTMRRTDTGTILAVAGEALIE